VAHENITARKLAEEQVKERERLAAIGSTAAMFAHQVGNPLNSISTTMQLLERRLARGDAPGGDTITTPLRQVGQEMQRLTILLDQFRVLTRPHTPYLQPIHLASFVGETLATQALDHAARKITVEHAFPPDLPPILADRERLRQALCHLCKNAVEAMPQGGTLTFRASATEGQVSLDISDTGVGIPGNIDIFAPFVTTKAQSSGLGLTVVRQIIAAHGGAVTYHSTPGQGTMFTLTLPISPIVL
jgi:two-component system sensor histidine kinase HydH